MHRLHHLDRPWHRHPWIVPVLLAGLSLGLVAMALVDGSPLLAAAIAAAAAAWAWRERALHRRRRALEGELAGAEAELGRVRGTEAQARAEAEQALRARDEFVATVSHELRTPLNAVLGWARLLRMGKLDAQTSARAIETIERSAAAQAQTVDDVLDVSRILRGELRLDVRQVDLLLVIEAAVDSVRAAAAARQIVLAISLSPQTGQVAGDQARLRQVVWNLLSNAVKFTAPGGRVEVRLDREDEEVVIAVRDTGAGLDPSFVPHLFERFRQADSSSTRPHGGLGLGLALVRHLVEAHGGSVRAESEGRGRGSTFVVRLPSSAPRRVAGAAPRAVPVPVPAAPDGPWPLAGLSRLRVLVVDDDPDSREVVREVLEQAGAVVSTAGSTPEALRAIAERPPDVLLSDLGMPGEDGYQLMRRVRALDPVAGGTVPAAALTAYTQAENRRAAQDAGFQGYLSKPIDPAELTAAVARLAGRLH